MLGPVLELLFGVGVAQQLGVPLRLRVHRGGVRAALLVFKRALLARVAVARVHRRVVAA